jgi:hypothetical protein
MNMNAWLKGLGVFVLSSVITALTATNLDPSNFNFTKQGVLKLGTLMLIIAGKAVLLYFQKSPLQINPTGSSGPSSLSVAKDLGARPPSSFVSAVALGLLVPSVLALTGCVNVWERSTYATLAASKSLIDCAIAGYNASDTDIRQYCAADASDPNFDPGMFHIPRTREAQQLIEKARQVQTASVQAFEAYAVAKVARDPSVSLAAKEAAVMSEIAELPQLISSIRALFAKQPSASARSDNHVNEGNALIEVRTLFPITRLPDLRALEVKHGK